MSVSYLCVNRGVLISGLLIKDTFRGVMIIGGMILGGSY